MAKCLNGVARSNNILAQLDNPHSDDETIAALARFLLHVYHSRSRPRRAPLRLPAQTPAAFSDAWLEALMRAAGTLPRNQRGSFLRVIVNLLGNG